jgi:DNA-directed RNA polymerase subunit M/transcription elongation factor TFIIS
MSSIFHAWLFLQDGSSQGLSLSPIGSNNLNNSIEKIINYKSFLKLIPNPAEESKLKMVAEWEASGEYYQLYGWLSGPSSKINSHNFDLDDYPDQDLYGDLILFKVDLNTHKCMQITEVDVQTIDIAKRKDEIEEEQYEEDNENDEDYDSDDKEKGKDDDEEDDEDEEENDENFDYEDDKADGDDGLDAEADEEEYYEDDDYTDVKKKSASNKTVVCNFSHLVCEGILTEKETDESYVLNEKQTKVIEIFEKLLNKYKPKQSMLQNLERGIYNWTIREANKFGFTCLWEDRQFNKIYIRKSISIYQNLLDNQELHKFIMEEGDNAYNISFMTPNELCPDKYTDIITKLKEKEKVMFEKRATAGSKHIKCNKCGERDVSVAAAQTRSGDESMTLFYCCNNCGKQWKRS